MRKNGGGVPVFIGFFILSLLIFFFLHKSIAGLFENITVPLQRIAFGIFHNPSDNKTEVEKLCEENKKLLTQLAKQKELEKENQALRDQFRTTDPSSRDLLPARIVGKSGDTIVIDKGTSEGVQEGSIIVVKDTLVGKAVTVSSHIAVVHVITHEKVTFTAESIKTSSLGVVAGKGGNKMLFGNVVLTEKLEKNDLVRTKGDINEKGQGFPPGLIVGKIIAVYKSPSALFQAAEVRSLVDFVKLETVFVMSNN